MSRIEKVDVLIVGSGPAGTSTALHLLQRDAGWAGRIVILDKAVHPREKLCGGGITHLGQNILIRLGLKLEPSSFDVREARLMYEDRSYSFLGNPVFRIVRRDEFDHWLVKTAEKQGAQVYQGEGATKIAIHADHVEVATEQRIFHAKVLVAADGSRSFVRRALKWPSESRVARLLEILTPEEEQTQSEFRDAVAVFDFTHTFDGLQGYYWDFPSYVKGKPFMNRGLFDSRARPERPKADLKRSLRESLAERKRDLDDYQLKGHPIRWWNRKGPFSMARVVLVGDAAGADPLMGEGISFALGYGAVAAGAINDAFKRQDYSFASYRKRLLADPLFRQLDLRTRLARIAYRIKSPIVFRFAWRLASWIVRFTRWRDPDFKPVESSELILNTEGRFSSGA
jgi:geranylgeranyl reductase family protein